MSTTSQKTAGEITARGYRTVNYIRLGLAFLFGTAVAATGIGHFHRSLIQAEAVGTVVYLVVGLLGLYLMRGGRTPRIFARLAVLLDALVLGGLMIFVSLDTPSEAYMMAKNSIVYSVFFILIVYSSFLGSSYFTLILSLLSTLLYGGSMLAAAHTGVEFGMKNDFTINQVGIPDAVIMSVFLTVAGSIVAGVLRVQKQLSNISEDHARSNAELVSSLTDQRHVLEMHAKQLSQTTDTFKSFVEDTTKRIESQAAALQQANAVTEELTASASQTQDIIQNQTRGIESMAEGSTELNALINEISASNQELTASAGDAVRSMETVLDAVQGTNQTLAGLEEAFKNVNQITEVMTEIADKTNLLSLNASIEAARAGDAGRGFAVVANEVSKLADFTGQNVRQISQIVTESMSTIDQARQQSGQASSQASHQKNQTIRTNENVEKTSSLLRKQAGILQNLVKELETQKGRASEVLNSSREQIDGQKELARTMESLDKEITEINEAARNLGEGVQRISDQATELSRLSHA